jgi:hypothetical protein
MPRKRSPIAVALLLLSTGPVLVAGTADRAEAGRVVADTVAKPVVLAPGPDGAARAAADRALAALSGHVRTRSHPDGLRLAFQAYYRYASAHPEEVTNPHFFYVDYGLDNRTPRGWVFDMAALELVEGPFTVAHGSGSSAGRNEVPTRFSNRPGSYMTSLGLYLTQETYGFRGASGGRRYTSVGLRMKGLSGSFNDAARRRGIVSHGAPYVSRTDAGRSQGCPAMEQARARRLLPKLAGGGLVFLFSPRHEDWLREGPWVAGTPIATR